MKPLSLLLLPLALALPASAQDAPPAAPLLPPPATEAPAPLGPFKDLKERHSYGLGIFLGNREKQNAANNPDNKGLNADDLLAGLKDGLSGARSIDYSSGLAMATQIQRSGVEIDPGVLAEAVKAAVENQAAKISPTDVQAIMQELQASIQERQKAKAAAEAAANLAGATAWLEENAKKEGVKVTASGLQYIMDQNGEGRTPGPRDVVTVNITGTSTDGTEFDRSAEGTPARRALMAMPKGLQEGLQMMKDGGKARFWLPPALGFGETPRGPSLKGNSVLAFTVELISSEEPPAAQPGAPGQNPAAAVKRAPISAVTPPVSVEIPEGGGPPRIRIEGQPETPQAPPTPPAPDVKPEAK